MAIMQECPICHKKQKTSNKLCSCGENLDKAKKSKKVRYWISYYLPGGKKRMESVGKFEDLDPYSISDAKDALSMRMVQKRERPELFKTQPEGDMTFNQLTEWFLPFERDRAVAGEISEDYLYRKKINLNTFNAEFGDMVVNAIQSQDLNRYKAIRKTSGKSDSYIDQELGSAKSMINTAFDNRKVGGDTIRIFKSCKKLLKKGANSRDIVLTYPEYKNLYAAVPEHLKTIARKAGVDKNVRSVIFGHSNPNDMDLRYDTVDEEDMIDAIDKIETFLKSSYYRSYYDTKKSSQNRES